MTTDLRELLGRVASGESSPDEAAALLSSWGLASVGHHRIDTHRAGRAVVPEVIYGEAKSAEQLIEIAEHFIATDRPMLVTRVQPDKARVLVERFPSLTHHAAARMITRGRTAGEPVRGSVAVVSAGSSDHPVAEEAALTLEFFGAAVHRASDCGVAGLHRLFAVGDALAAADVLIVVAGMEGALPSVVGGLFSKLVIAVPTSVGYGASFGGIAALLGMLNSCSPGVVVVNIDNGFGAAVAALATLRSTPKR